MLQLSASLVSSSTPLLGAHTILPAHSGIALLYELLFTLKTLPCMHYLEGKNTPLEGKCLGVEQTNVARKYRTKARILEGSYKPPWA